MALEDYVLYLYYISNGISDKILSIIPADLIYRVDYIGI